MPLGSVGGAGAGHEADTAEAQFGVHLMVSTGAQRRDRLGFSTRRLRHLQFQPHSGRHQAIRLLILLAAQHINQRPGSELAGEGNSDCRREHRATHRLPGCEILASKAELAKTRHERALTAHCCEVVGCERTARSPIWFLQFPAHWPRRGVRDVITGRLSMQPRPSCSAFVNKLTHTLFRAPPDRG